ncbi:hypothetical protein OBV_39720 [Oscillibacter valericigenes Sjm18-20]|nr:hypothetical protein OBV_39720 [Oscillibacter valericigenes Sjm18-20]
MAIKKQRTRNEYLYKNAKFKQMYFLQKRMAETKRKEIESNKIYQNNNNKNK